MHVAGSAPPGCLAVSLLSPDVLEVVIGICTMASCHTFVVWGGHCGCLKLGHRGGKKEIGCYCLWGVRFSPTTASLFTLFVRCASPVVMLPHQNTEASNGQGTTDDT